MKKKKDIRLEAIKWQKIYSVAFVALSVVTIFMAIYFNVFPQPHKPNIHLSTNSENDEIFFYKNRDSDSVDFLLHIYNQGSGKCINAKLEHPEFLYPNIRDQKNFRMYTDIEGKLTNNFTSMAFLVPNNIWSMGVLDENQILTIDLIRDYDNIHIPEKFELAVTCDNSKKTIIKMTAKNPSK